MKPGPWTMSSTGCNGIIPPNTGCDPLVLVTNYRFGTLLSIGALDQQR